MFGVGGTACVYTELRELFSTQVHVISISWTQDETTSTAAWLQRQCHEYMKLGIMGITVLAATGDSGVGDVCTEPSTNQAYKDERSKTAASSTPTSRLRALT